MHDTIHSSKKILYALHYFLNQFLEFFRTNRDISSIRVVVRRSRARFDGGTHQHGGRTLQRGFWFKAGYVARGIRYWETAVKQGDVESRHSLGHIEYNRGNCNRVRHFLISAKMGYKESLDAIKKVLVENLATKAQYAEALRGYQDAVEETKSSRRDEAMKIGFITSYTCALIRHRKKH